MAVLTTSGNYTWSQTAIDLITAALRIDQIIGEEETPTGFQLEMALDSLNAMVKGWMASGIHLWTEEEAILFPQKGQVQYSLGATSTDNACLFTQFAQTQLASTALAGATTISVLSATGIANGYFLGVQLDSGVNYWTQVNGAPSGTTITLLGALPSQASGNAFVFSYPTALIRPLRLYTGRRYTYQNQIDIPMLAMSRTDYANQPNKYTAGVITQYFFDPQINPTGSASTAPVALLNMWPNPVDYASGFRFTAQRPIQDFSNLANLPDLPVEWNAALKWNLALEIAPQYGVPSEQLQIVQAQAARWFGMAQSWDREPEGIRFGVAWQPSYRRQA